MHILPFKYQAIGFCLFEGGDEVDGLKHEQELLRQELRDINQANKNVKNVLRGITN